MGQRLANAVSNASGIGIIGSCSINANVLKERFIKCKIATENPFVVNVLLLYPNIDQHIQLIIDYKVPFVFPSAGNPKTFTSVLKAGGIKVDTL